MSTETTPTADTAQAPQSLRLDARATAMLKAMGVNWRWPAPEQTSNQAIAPVAAVATPVVADSARAPSATATVSSPLAPTTHVTAAHPEPVATSQAPLARTAPVPVQPSVLSTPQPLIALDGLNWDGLQQAARACQACSLAPGRVGHSWGQGSERAKWLFITPRLNPSDDGEQTVQGDELALLQSLWRAMGVLEADVFVTALAKCRAALGLNASEADTQQCLSYLHHQVQWLQPDMIVALGLPVAHALMGANDAPLAQWRGRMHQWQNTPTVVTYPLDVLLRRPVDKAKWWADLCLAQDHLTANETP